MYVRGKGRKWEFLKGEMREKKKETCATIKRDY